MVLQDTFKPPTSAFSVSKDDASMLKQLAFREGPTFSIFILATIISNHSKHLYTYMPSFDLTILKNISNKFKSSNSAFANEHLKHPSNLFQEPERSFLLLDESHSHGVCNRSQRPSPNLRFWTLEHTSTVQPSQVGRPTLATRRKSPQWIQVMLIDDPE